MQLVIGGAFQGKLDYVKEQYNIEEETIVWGETEVLDVKKWEEKKPITKVIKDFHILILRWLKEDYDVENMVEQILKENKDIIIISNEIGYGIVPIDALERKWREKTGRICCMLAKKADQVVRVNSGIGVVIKEKKKPLEIVLIRHGKTKGNEEHRYVGITDEELTQEGRVSLSKIEYPIVQYVFTSPLLRCRQTTSCVYKNIEYEIVEGLEECNFGIYEYKNYEELKNQVAYDAWLQSNGTIGFPEGESRDVFKKRTLEAFWYVVQRAKEKKLDKIALVVHGGTIMAILDELSSPNEDFYHWQVKNGEGFEAILNENKLSSIVSILSKEE